MRGIQKMIILMNCQILRTNIKIIACQRRVVREEEGQGELTLFTILGLKGLNCYIWLSVSFVIK